MPNYKFSCSAMPTINNHSVKSLEPDANGLYSVVLGAIGMPTRMNVWYDEASMIEAMNDPTKRFNICLRDGNLMGCWGHPVIRSKEDLPKLMEIDETRVSHVFMKIWVDDPIYMNGYNAHPIRALVKPFGPYGGVLEKSLRDPLINTAFSIRSLCLPMNGPDPKFEYRKVQLITTFDAVHAPGYEMATKRYAAGTESFNEIDVNKQDLETAVKSIGMESSKMITDADILKLYREETYRLNHKLVATGLHGSKSIINPDGNLGSAAAVAYRRS